jgi:hypothetical protein
MLLRHHRGPAAAVRLPGGLCLHGRSLLRPAAVALLPLRLHLSGIPSSPALRCDGSQSAVLLLLVLLRLHLLLRTLCAGQRLPQAVQLMLRLLLGELLCWLLQRLEPGWTARVQGHPVDQCAAAVAGATAEGTRGARAWHTR